MQRQVVFVLILVVAVSCKLFQNNQFIDDAKCKIHDIDEANQFLHPLLNKLRTRTFFKIFKVDLESECPYWVSRHVCAFKPGNGNGSPPACSVCKCEESEI